MITVEQERWYTVIINVPGWLSFYPFSCDKSTVFHNNVVISISVNSSIINYYLRIQLTKLGCHFSYGLLFSMLFLKSCGGSH